MWDRDGCRTWTAARHWWRAFPFRCRSGTAIRGTSKRRRPGSQKPPFKSKCSPESAAALAPTETLPSHLMKNRLTMIHLLILLGTFAACEKTPDTKSEAGEKKAEQHDDGE